MTGRFRPGFGSGGIGCWVNGPTRFVRIPTRFVHLTLNNPDPLSFRQQGA